MPIRQELFSPVNAFIQGRAARQQHDYGESRNALAQMEVEQAPREMANRNALAERQQKQFTDQDRFANTEWMAGASQQVLALPPENQPQAAAAMFEEAKRRGIVQTNAQMPPFDPQKLQQFVADAKVQLGQAPAVQMQTIGDISNPSAGILQKDPTTGAIRQVVAPQAPRAPDHFEATQAAADRRAREQREFTAEQNRLAREAAAAKDNSKENDTEAGKQTTWNVYQTARDSLMNAMDETETGAVVGRLPAVTAAQQTAEGSVAAMAPVLKQLFRSAGEGVFTDRDQALLLDMVPKRTDQPEARKNKMANIDAIVQAKLGMGGNSPQQPQQGAAPPQAVEYLKANPQFKGAFRQKYGYLPDGL